jgi:hypothetical protein
MAEIGGAQIDLRPRNPFAPSMPFTPDFGGFTGYARRMAAVHPLPAPVHWRPNAPLHAVARGLREWGSGCSYSTFFRIYERPLLTSEAIRMWRAEFASKCAEREPRPPTGR